MGGLKASVFSLTALVALSAQQANALDLGCQYEWSGPSSGNDVGDCAKNYPSNNPGMLVPTAIPLFFTAVLLLTFPIIFLGRCCGLFGSNEQRPGAGCCCDGSEWDAESEDKKAKVYHSQPCQITMLKCGALLLVLMSISTVVLMPLGASKAVSSWNYMLDNVEPDIFKWLEDRRDEILTGVRNDDGTLPAPLTDDSFNVINDTLDDVRKIRDDVKDATNTAVEVLNYITYALCALPIVGMGLTLLFALCNCRRFCPACFQCVFYPLGIIYGLFGAVFITFGLSMFLVDGEVKLQEKALPGIFSWYILPYCESELGFEDIKTTITGAITEASENGCLKILDICDENPVIVDPMSTSEAQFYCPGLSQSTVPDRCNTPTDLMRLINTTYAKQGSYVCATGTFPTLVPQNCSISECPDDCIDSQMQTTASEAITQVATGERVAKVLTRALLFADCDVLATQFIKPLADMHSGGEGFYYAGGGFSVGMLCFILAMLVLCKGQKVFVAEPSLEANSPVDFSDPKPW